MAEESVVANASKEVPADAAEISASASVTGILKLSNIERTDLATDFHPAMSHVDDITQEIKFHFALIRDTWTMNHIRTLIIGILAFLIGSISEDIVTGGNPFTSGTEGVRELGGFGFFQVTLSIALWFWFVIELWKLFPIMKGHSINLLVTWGAGMVGMILFHIPNTDFPLAVSFGDLLGGLVGVAAMIFFSFIVKMAVTETRDEHVRIRHFSEDPREIEAQMREHSLKAWAGSFIIWFFLILINTWAGVHFVAERHAERNLVLVLHLITGVYLIAATMHVLWYPQMMLGTGTTKVLSNRARESHRYDSDIEDSSNLNSNEASTNEKEGNMIAGYCPECNAPSPIHRMADGEPFVPCPNEVCSGGGNPLANCPQCKTELPARLTCTSCSINAPVADFLPNVEAW
jgi:hypothetical protein